MTTVEVIAYATDKFAMNAQHLVWNNQRMEDHALPVQANFAILVLRITSVECITPDAQWQMEWKAMFLELHVLHVLLQIVISVVLTKFANNVPRDLDCQV